MAGNDYTFDEYGVEAADLNERRLRAAAALLRGSDPNGGLMSPFNTLNMMDRVRAYGEISNIERDRKQMSERYTSALSNALRDADPEVRNLVMHPATRQQGLDLLKKQQQMKLDREEMESYRTPGNSNGTVGGGTTAGGIDLATARRMSMSSNPTIAARGKQALEFFKGHDPKDNMRVDDAGNSIPIPGMADAYIDQQRQIVTNREAATHPMGYAVPSGTGGTTQVPYPGGSALPGATGQANGPVGPNPATLPSGPPASPASGPISPGNGLSGGPPSALPNATGGAPAQSQIVQQMFAALKDPTVPMEQKEQIAITLGKMGIKFNSAHDQPQAVNPQENRALPRTVGVSQPNAGFGNTNPPRQEVWKDQAKNADDVVKDMQLKASNGGKIIDALSKIEKWNAQPTWSGGFGPMATTIGNWAGSFTGGADDRTMNTQSMDAAIQNVLGPMLKEYGYNPSNIDLVAAAKRMPAINQDPRVRSQIMADIKSGIQAEMAVNQEAFRRIDEAKNQGIVVNPKQILDQVWMEYNAERTAKERFPNPTQPGGASSALPGARSAVQTPEPPAGGGGIGEFGKDLYRNAVALPGALFSRQGLDAAKDAYGNIIEGGKELIGFGDRPAAMADIQRQEERKRTDPAYNQASIFHGIANPTALIGGTATSIPKVALAAGMQGALNPAESFTDQIVNFLKSGTIGAVTAGATKIIPSTAVAKGMDLDGTADDLLSKFPSFRPTSVQMNPGTWESKLAAGAGINDAAALAQTKAITKDLMAKAGIPGEVLTPKGVEQAAKDIGKEFDVLLPKNIKVKIDSTDIANLQQAIKNAAQVQDFMAKSPTLAAIHNAVLSGNPGRISAQALHNAWKEVGSTGAPKQVAAEIRDVLEGLISKAIPGRDFAKFQALNQKWGLLQDIERVWRGGGSEGTGLAAGFLNPAKIVNEAGTGPVMSMMDDAARLIQKFQVRNFVPEKIDGMVDMAQAAARHTVGPVLNTLDKVPRPTGQVGKTIAEMLRAGVGRALPGVYDPTNTNAPPVQ